MADITTQEVTDEAQGETTPTGATSPEKPRREPVFKHIVGYWHYGVILTYLALILSVCAICFACGPRRGDIAAFLILLAGLCDAFDGMVAKTRKRRSDNDRLFGMRIDSLSDMTAFGVAPITVGVAMGMTAWYYAIVYAFFALCGLVRLAHFDVIECNNFYSKSSGRRDVYEGLPITTVSLALPVFYLIATLFNTHPEWVGLDGDSLLIYQGVMMSICYVACGLLFVIRFKMPKPRARGRIITVVAITVITISLSLIRYYVFDVVLFEPISAAVASVVAL